MAGSSPKKWSSNRFSNPSKPETAIGMRVCVCMIVLGRRGCNVTEENRGVLLGDKGLKLAQEAEREKNLIGRVEVR